VARELRLQGCFRQTLLIAITGFADEARRRLAQEAGYDLFLIKPVDLLALQKLLVVAKNRLADSTSWKIDERDFLGRFGTESCACGGTRFECFSFVG
jgi:hypothetical protein